MSNVSRGAYAYTLVEVSGAVSPETGAELSALDHVTRVRVIAREA